MYNGSYIGKLGYTLLKSEISHEDIQKIKKDLYVKPFVPKCIQQVCEPFPVFRESTNKYYFAGIFRYRKIHTPSHRCIQLNIFAYTLSAAQQTA